MTLKDKALAARQEADQNAIEREKENRLNEFKKERATLQCYIKAALDIDLYNPDTYGEHTVEPDPEKGAQVTIDGLTLRYTTHFDSSGPNKRAYLIRPCTVAGCDGELWHALDSWSPDYLLPSLGRELSEDYTKPKCGACQERKENELAAQRPPKPQRVCSDTEETLLNALYELARIEINTRFGDEAE